MISIIQHGVRSSDLLGRRLSAMRARVERDILEDLELDAQRRDFAVGEAIFRDDEAKGDLRVLVSGVAGECRLLTDGRRQILALRLPGDHRRPPGPLGAAVRNVLSDAGSRE